MNEDIDVKLLKIDEFKKAISRYGTIDKNLSSKLKEFYRISSVYTTNAVEGNTLTESETKVVIENGITIGGKSLREHLEAVNSAKAYDFIYSIVSRNLITEDDVLKCHKYVLAGIDDVYAGVYRKEDVFITGTEFFPPSWKKVPELMKGFVDRLNESSNRHAVIKTAELHAEFESIHPFADGNGRVGRFILSLELIKNGYPPFMVYPVKRLDYINSLRIYQTKNDISEIRKFVVENVYETIKALKRFLDNTIGESEKIALNGSDHDAFTEDLKRRREQSKGLKR